MPKIARNFLENQQYLISISGSLGSRRMKTASSSGFLGAKKLPPSA
jgi:hypothetical protein